MPITDFPPEILRECLSYLGQDDLQRASLVCRNWLWPSKDLYWEQATVETNRTCGDYLEKLGSMLGNNSRIPRILGELIIDTGVADERKKACLEFLAKVLEHFNCVRKLSIHWLDLTKFPSGKQQRMLSNIIVSEALTIHTLRVADLSDVTSLIFNNRKLGYLELGDIQVEESKRNGDTQGGTAVTSVDQLAAEETRPNLPRRRHLVLYPGDPYLSAAPTSMPTWLATITTSHQEESVVHKRRTYLGLRPTGVVNLSLPAQRDSLGSVVSISDTSYEETNTVYKLIETLSGTLHSLTLGMHPRIRYDLSNTTSVVNLAFDLCTFGPSEETLSDLIYTLQRIANPKSVVINIGDVYDHANRPDFDVGGALVSDGEVEIDREYGQRRSWEEIDTMLANLEGLEEITLTQEIRAIATPTDLTLAWISSEEVDEVRVNRLAKIAPERLPKCKERGLLWIKALRCPWYSFDFDSWTGETPGPYESYYHVRLGPIHEMTTD